jgi:hypothetical protein
MDLLWYSRYRRGAGRDRFLGWELSGSVTGFDDAPAPAQVGRRAAKALFKTDLPDSAASLTNNVVHWATGAQWGAIYGLACGLTGQSNPALGLVLGPTAWGSSYLLLGAAKIYKPIWDYDTRTLAEDLTAHLLFGAVTATTFRVLTRR